MNDRKTIPESAPPASQPPAGGTATGRARRLLFGFGAVCLGLLPFLVVEAGLRVFDRGRPADSPDPMAGFSRFPLFEQRGKVYRTSRSYAPFIAPQEFPVEKPRGGFRVFCFGGSTTYGHPYLGDTSYAKWLELELGGSDPTRGWQVINCGGVSYASYRMAPLVQQVLHYKPDLIILESAHNEFLEDRTYTAVKSRSTSWAWIQDRVNALRTVSLVRNWLARARPAASPLDAGADRNAGLTPDFNTRLEFASGYASYERDEAWHQRVIAQFDESIRAIVAQCRAAHVPILLLRLGSNLRDCPPFKSEHRAGLTSAQEQAWQAACDLAKATEAVDLPRALQSYQEAAAIDGTYALLDYRIARTLDRLERRTEALTYFEKAKDEDICPLRVITPLDRSLIRIAGETGAPLVDVARLLADRSPDHIPGNDWYVDHVHPTIGGQQLMARALAAQMRESGLLARAAVWPEEQRRETYARHLNSLGQGYFADGERRVAWLDGWSRRQRLASEGFPNDARGYVRLGFRRLELGETARAWEALDQALKRDRGVTSLIQAHAQELIQEGRPETAAALLRQLN